MVPRRGLEPPHLAALDPKSSVSTNFTTWAWGGYNQLIVFYQDLKQLFFYHSRTKIDPGTNEWENIYLKQKRLKK